MNNQTCPLQYPDLLQSEPWGIRAAWWLLNLKKPRLYGAFGATEEEALLLENKPHTPGEINQFAQDHQYPGWSYSKPWETLPLAIQLEMAKDVRADGSTAFSGCQWPDVFRSENPVTSLGYDYAGQFHRLMPEHGELAHIETELQALGWLAERLGYRIETRSLVLARKGWNFWRAAQPVAGNHDTTPLWYLYEEINHRVNTVPLRCGHRTKAGIRVSLTDFTAPDITKLALWYFERGGEGTLNLRLNAGFTRPTPTLQLVPDGWTGLEWVTEGFK